MFARRGSRGYTMSPKIVIKRKKKAAPRSMTSCWPIRPSVRITLWEHFVMQVRFIGIVIWKWSCQVLWVEVGHATCARARVCVCRTCSFSWISDRDFVCVSTSSLLSVWVGACAYECMVEWVHGHVGGCETQVWHCKCTVHACVWLLSVARKAPWLMLLPTNVHLRPWFKKVLGPQSLLFVCPHQRYAFDMPKVQTTLACTLAYRHNTGLDVYAQTNFSLRLQ